MNHGVNLPLSRRLKAISHEELSQWTPCWRVRGKFSRVYQMSFYRFHDDWPSIVYDKDTKWHSSRFKYYEGNEKHGEKEGLTNRNEAAMYSAFHICKNLRVTWNL